MLSVLTLFAAPISQTEAVDVALKFYQFHAPNALINTEIQNIIPEMYRGKITFYTVLFKTGFVLVSADDATTPILGYSYESDGDLSKRNPYVKAWLNNANEEIYNIVEKEISNESTKEDWITIRKQRFLKSTNDVQPLLKTIWDQTYYFNRLCPEDPKAIGSDIKGRVYTGCVSTAMAQVMKFYNYPTSGAGKNSYTPKQNPQYGVLSVDFSGAVYSWNQMPDTLKTISYAVSHLMYHAGVSVNMNYDDEGSGSYDFDAADALKNYFSYASTVKLEEKSTYSETAWLALLSAELDKGRPIIYSGHSPTGGHSFVLDGYKTGTITSFHINWGWSGSYNGYFYIGALNPTPPNLTGYNDYNTAIVGIKPGNANLAPRLSTPERDRVYNQGEDVTVTANLLKGTNAKLIVEIDGVTKATTTAGEITYTWNTSTANPGFHYIVSKAISGSDTAYYERRAIVTAWNKKASNFNIKNRSIDQIKFATKDIIWTKAGDATTDAQIREFSVTLDGGNTWSINTINIANINLEGYGVGNICPLDGNTAWASMFAPAGGGLIAKTIDGGKTWEKQTTALFTAPAGFPNVVHFWDANNGVCMGDPNSGYFEIYTTINGGTNWTRVAKSKIPTYQTDEAGTTDLFDVKGDTIWFGTSKGRIYRSIDKGTNWTVASTGITDGQTNVKFRDNKRGVAYKQAAPYTAKQTYDGGITWYAYKLPKYFREGLLVAVPKTKGRWLNVSYDGSAISNDDLYSWTPLDTAIAYTALAFYDLNTGFAGGINENATMGGIYKWKNLVTTDPSMKIMESSIENVFFKLYPNPASKYLTISSDKMENTDVQVSIFNANGQYVNAMKIPNKQSVFKYELNVQDLQKGLYLIKITNGAKQYTNRLIVE